MAIRILLFVFAIGVFYLLWLTGKHISFEFLYRSQVIDLVCEMVKPEYLKRESECE